MKINMTSHVSIATFNKQRLLVRRYFQVKINTACIEFIQGMSPKLKKVEGGIREECQTQLSNRLQYISYYLLVLVKYHFLSIYLYCKNKVV